MSLYPAPPAIHLWPPASSKLNSQGVYCSLMTGQERREVPFASHVSCTIEMASTTNEYEVAVIDEIQMLADEQRGASWTAVSGAGSARWGGRDAAGKRF